MELHGFEKLLFTLEDDRYALVDGMDRVQDRHEHTTLLAYAQESVFGLEIIRGDEITVEKHHVRGTRERDADAHRADGTRETEKLALLESLDNGRAFAIGRVARNLRPSLAPAEDVDRIAVIREGDHGLIFLFALFDEGSQRAELERGQFFPDRRKRAASRTLGEYLVVVPVTELEELVVGELDVLREGSCIDGHIDCASRLSRKLPKHVHAHAAKHHRTQALASLGRREAGFEFVTTVNAVHEVLATAEYLQEILPRTERVPSAVVEVAAAAWEDLAKRPKLGRLVQKRRPSQEPNRVALRRDGAHGGRALRVFRLAIVSFIHHERDRALGFLADPHPLRPRLFPLHETTRLDVALDVATKTAALRIALICPRLALLLKDAHLV